MRHKHGVCSKRSRRKCTACIKPEPSDPEQCRADDCKWYIVRHHDIRAEILSASKHQRSCKGCKTCACMNHNTAGKVEHAHFCKPPSSPHPMRKWVVDEDAPCQDEDDKRAPLDSFCKGTCDKEWCNDCKHHLVSGKCHTWNSRCVVE